MEVRIWGSHRYTDLDHSTGEIKTTTWKILEKLVSITTLDTRKGEGPFPTQEKGPSQHSDINPLTGDVYQNQNLSGALTPGREKPAVIVSECTMAQSPFKNQFKESKLSGSAGHATLQNSEVLVLSTHVQLTVHAIIPSSECRLLCAISMCVCCTYCFLIL